MWTFVTDTPSAVQAIMLISCLVMGLSHILRPSLWVNFFESLIQRGGAGVVTNAMINALPGSVIVALHQVWTGPAILVTLYGWALLTKTVLSLLFPTIGMRSLQMSRRGNRAFVGGGVGLLVVAAACALALAGIGR